MQKAIDAGAYDVVVEALQRCHELGLGRMSVNRYSIIMDALAKKGQLHPVIRCAAYSHVQHYHHAGI